jgi:hypothetical protein
MSLWSDYSANLYARSAFKGTEFFAAYETHLARFCGRTVTMLEIGVSNGGSLEMWKRYLGPSAQIVGIDIDPRCREYEGPQMAVRIGDQSDRAFLLAVLEEFGPIDIVLDDGSHRAEDIAASFDVLYPRLERNGVYVVEDTATSYLAPWGGGIGAEGGFLETVKARIDELHADFVPALGPTPFTELTRSLHVYKNLVVFERGRTVDRRAFRTRPDERRTEGDPVTIELDDQATRRR